MACLPGMLGFYTWSGSRDKDGFREYKVSFKVLVDATAGVPSGPATALATPGLYLPGSPYAVGDDFDIDAICQWTADMKPMVEERTPYFIVEQIFSTRPNEKCINRIGTGTGTGNPANDPLSEPPRLSGSFVKYTEEKTKGKDGNFFKNSAHERIRGPLVEFDSNRLTINVTINESTLDLVGKTAIIDTVNSVPIWDFNERTLKLSNIVWQQKFSNDCTCYYETTYGFEMSPDGFDRIALDEGTKALHGEWNKTTGVWTLKNINGGAPNPNNPTHFIRITDFFDNPMRCILNGAGVPATTISGSGVGLEGSIDIIYYPETDHLGEIPGLPHSIECAA